MSPPKPTLFSFNQLGESACLPEVLARLLPLLGTSPHTASEVEALVAVDPALCVQLLAATRRVSGPRRLTIGSLLATCGEESLHGIVLSTSLRQLNHLRSQPLRQLAWQRCLRMAITARSIAQATQYAEPAEAYLAGLLLHYGFYLMAHHGGEGYAQLLQGTEENEALQLERESVHYGATYLQVSFTLLSSSPISPAAIDALRYRDQPLALLRDLHPLTRLLRLADMLVLQGASPLACDAGRQWFGLDPKSLANIATQGLIEQKILQQLQQPLAASGAEAGSSLWQALWSQASFAGTPSPATVLQRLGTSLNLQFGLEAVLILQHDAATHTLRAVTGASTHALANLSLRCEPDASRIADASLQAQMRQTIGEASSVAALADEQVARLLQRPGLLCLPFTSGVVVIGLDDEELDHCLPQLPAIKNMLAAASQALAQRPTAPPETHINQRIREARHEMAAPLTTLRNYLHLLAGKSTGANDELRIMREELTRIDRIIDRMDAPKAPLLLGPIDLNSMVLDVLASLRLIHPHIHEIEVWTELSRDMPPVLADAGTLKQICTNLIQNAVEALPTGGLLRIGTAIDIDHHGTRQGVFAVTDNGPGITAEMQQRLFQPQVSSKAGHAGLGLSIVKGLVDELSGRISCQSTPGEGTRFQVLLPFSLSSHST